MRGSPLTSSRMTSSTISTPASATSARTLVEPPGPKEDEEGWPHPSPPPLPPPPPKPPAPPPTLPPPVLGSDADALGINLALIRSCAEAARIDALAHRAAKAPAPCRNAGVACCRGWWCEVPGGAQGWLCDCRGRAACAKAAFLDLYSPSGCCPMVFCKGQAMIARGPQKGTWFPQR